MERLQKLLLLFVVCVLALATLSGTVAVLVWRKEDKGQLARLRREEIKDCTVFSPYFTLSSISFCFSLRSSNCLRDELPKA